MGIAEEISFENWCKVGIKRGFLQRITDEVTNNHINIVVNAQDNETLIESKKTLDGIRVGLANVATSMQEYGVGIKDDPHFDH